MDGKVSPSLKASQWRKAGAARTVCGLLAHQRANARELRTQCARPSRVPAFLTRSRYLNACRRVGRTCWENQDLRIDASSASSLSTSARSCVRPLALLLAIKSLMEMTGTSRPSTLTTFRFGAPLSGISESDFASEGSCRRRFRERLCHFRSAIAPVASIYPWLLAGSRTPQARKRRPAGN